MKADLSRISFDPAQHFSHVLLQQGRVTLDADSNEQAAILLHYLRTLARDLIGPCGGPTDALGFGLTLDTNDAGQKVLTIGAGRYYVDGILVENEAACDYAVQPDGPLAADDAVLQWLGQPQGDLWLYLDVWERHVSWIEDDAIREPALGGPDTCTRAKVVWQVRGMPRDALLKNLTARRDAIAAQLADTSGKLTEAQRDELRARYDRLDNDIAVLSPNANGQPGFDCKAPLDSLDGLSAALLTARLDPGAQVKDPCLLAPDAQYRGVENQLYRVEVHRGSAPGVAPTFKWSRDNGSVATRWLSTEGFDLIVTSTRGFDAGAWVELSDDALDLAGLPGTLVKLVKVQGDRLSVDPDTLANLALTPDRINPKVRRWDQTESDDITLIGGAVPLVETAPDAANWIDLEDGIQVQFSAGGSYRSGDYWLIPARVATGSIDWPHTVTVNGTTAVTNWQALPPRGIAHHYAPLAFLAANVDGTPQVQPCLCTIEPVNSCSRAQAAVAPAAPTPVPGRVAAPRAAGPLKVSATKPK